MKRAFFVIAVLLLSACNSGGISSDDFVGKWAGNIPADDGLLPTTIDFGENGTAVMSINAGFPVNEVTNWSWDGECLLFDDPASDEEEPGCNKVEFVSENSFIMTTENSGDVTWVRE